MSIFHTKSGAPIARTIEILEPMFGRHSADIALNYTCYPMSDEVSALQAQIMVDNICNSWFTNKPDPINNVLADIEAEFEKDVADAETRLEHNAQDEF